VDAASPDGAWRTVVPDAGAPGGMDRMMTVDLTDLLPPHTTRLRLTANLEIGYDQVFVASVRALPPTPAVRERPVRTSGFSPPEPDQAAEATTPPRGLTVPTLVGPSDVQSAGTVHVHRLSLSSATLRRLGFPREVSPDGRPPLIYDYHQLEPTAPFHVLRGAYTRYGAVEELLEAVDDRYVIMGSGDEVALRFAAEGLPALPERMTRSFILVSHAWCKDMDLYTLEPQTLDPLPFHGMSQYPYPQTERYPSTPTHRAYQARYNTRTQ
jgi:hypothetical protein